MMPQFKTTTVMVLAMAGVVTGIGAQELRDGPVRAESAPDVSRTIPRVCPKTATFQPNVEKCSYDHYQPG